MKYATIILGVAIVLASIAVAFNADAGWIEGKSRLTFPEAYRGTWCRTGNAYVKTKNVCPASSNEEILTIAATTYQIEEYQCKITRITVLNPRSMAVKLYCPDNVMIGEWRLDRSKLTIDWQ